MNTNEMKEELLAALATQHSKWLEQTITHEVLSALNKHKEKFVLRISASATDRSVTDAELRHFAISIKTLDAVLAIITDFSKLKELKTNS